MSNFKLEKMRTFVLLFFFLSSTLGFSQTAQEQIMDYLDEVEKSVNKYNRKINQLNQKVYNLSDVAAFQKKTKLTKSNLEKLIKKLDRIKLTDSLSRLKDISSSVLNQQLSYISDYHNFANSLSEEKENDNQALLVDFLDKKKEAGKEVNKVLTVYKKDLKGYCSKFNITFSYDEKGFENLKEYNLKMDDLTKHSLIYHKLSNLYNDFIEGANKSNTGKMGKTFDGMTNEISSSEKKIKEIKADASLTKATSKFVKAFKMTKSKEIFTILDIQKEGLTQDNIKVYNKAINSLSNKMAVSFNSYNNSINNYINQLSRLID